MKHIYYPAIIERGKDGFGVFFPDLPGCTSYGKTVQEAAINAEEALEGHLIVSAEYGDKIPAPSALDDIPQDPECNEAARILVRTDVPGKIQRLNITMEEGLVAAIDKASTNRSGFLAETARAKLREMRAGI